MKRATIWLALLAATLGEGRLLAQDPALPWFTVRTEHFEIHYHQGLERQARRVAAMAEAALELEGERLEYLPTGRIQVVMRDPGDQANGLASVLPYNRVVLLSSPPDDLSVLNDFDDPVWLVLVHELAHILHMDNVGGVPWLLDLVFGRWLFPNGVLPTWFLEGVAVSMESGFSAAGRLRSSLFRMMLRTAALAGRIPDMDRLGGSTQKWPQGNQPYLFGAFFVDFIQRRYGETALSDLSRETGKMMMPWAQNAVFKRVTGWDLLENYSWWREQMINEARQVEERIESEGKTPLLALTRRGQYQWLPRLSPGGRQVLYANLSVDEYPALHLLDLRDGSDRHLLEIDSADGAAFVPEGGVIIFCQQNVYRLHYLVGDLFALDLEKGKTIRLTRGARLRDPDVSADGTRLVAVQIEAGNTWLVLADLADGGRRLGKLRRVLLPEEGQVYTPRFSPDGREVVFGLSRPDGGRNLWRLEPDSGRLERLTEGRFMDLGPAFAADGSLWFSSDRTGIYNLYRLQGKRLRRMTNVTTGLFSPEPEPDGSGLVAVAYGPDGYDLVRLQLPLPEIEDEPEDDSRPPPLPMGDEAEVPPAAPYRPWWTLWPRAWLPTWGSDVLGNTIGAVAGGSDAAGKLTYQLAVDFGLESQRVNFDFDLSARVADPTIYLYGSRRAVRDAWAWVGEHWVGVDGMRAVFFLEGDLAFPGLRLSHGLFANFEARTFDSWTRLEPGPWDQTPVLPPRGALVWLGAGWWISSVRSYIASISREEGASAWVSLRFCHPSWGAGSKLIETRGAASLYLPLSRRLHHVLALGMRAGASFGDERRKTLFSAGGLPLSDPVRDIFFGYRYGGIALRGFPEGAFYGPAYLLGSLEWRFPLWEIERGVLSLPFFLERLHGAVFADAGQIGDPLFVADSFHLGAGGELRADLLLGYHLPVTLRFGYGRGITARGTDNVYLVLGWAF